MRSAHTLFGFVVLTFVAGCSLFVARGSGKPATEPRNVSDFTAVALNGSGKLNIEQTGTESLSITADDNLLQYLTSEVRDGKLILGTRDATGVNPTTDIVYNLTIKTLNSISLSGSGTVEAKGIVTDHLKTSLAGAGDFIMSGQAVEHEVALSGSGKLEAASLESKVVKVSIMGSGNGVVAASEQLEVNVMGSGSVEYIGDPAVSKNVMGSGSVTKR